MTTKQRIARLEGAYEHLATSADLAELEGELKGEIKELKGSVRGWLIGVGAALAVLNVLLRFFPGQVTP